MARSVSDGTVIIKTDVSTDSQPRIDSVIPVAVLIGDRTASAGEAIAVAFSGRAKTRSFGHRTSGQSTGLVILPLSNGSKIALAVSYLVDVKGSIYSTAISPDTNVAAGTDNAHQTTIDVAVEWIHDESKCER